MYREFKLQQTMYCQAFHHLSFCLHRYTGNTGIAVPHRALLLYSQASTCSYYYCSCHIHDRISCCGTNLENKEWVHIKCTRTGQAKYIWTVTQFQMIKPTFATCGSTKNNKKKTQVVEKCLNSTTVLGNWLYYFLYTFNFWKPTF